MLIALCLKTYEIESLNSKQIAMLKSLAEEYSGFSYGIRNGMHAFVCDLTDEDDHLTLVASFAGNVRACIGIDECEDLGAPECVSFRVCKESAMEGLEYTLYENDCIAYNASMKDILHLSK